MSTARTILLGAIAGGTIFIGLPLGRLRRITPGLRAFLSALATGILLFLLFDILKNAIEPLEVAVTRARGGAGSWSSLTGLAAVFVVGLATELVLVAAGA